jgi:WD40 repeat protein
MSLSLQIEQSDQSGQQTCILAGSPQSPGIIITRPKVSAHSFNIIAGSYEKVLYGLEATIGTTGSSTAPPSLTFSPIFAFVAHVGYVKAIATSPLGGKWLATGSTDEVVKVWDLRRRKEVGGLVHHKGLSSDLRVIGSTVQ